MPRYRVLELSFIGDRLREPDEEIDFDGLPGSNLLPLDAAARKAAKAAEALALAGGAFTDPEGEEAAPIDLT
ncbi:MAG TPA: hypothetical protein VF920_02450 [Dongiaceae bacterium]